MKPNIYNALTFATILLFALFPLLFSLPFRIHLDLPWEGTYRLYLGQTPYKDFGMPLGYGFFIIPLFCFYIFGPALKTLLLAQTFITIISALTFRNILKHFNIESYKIFIATTIFCLSYTFIYFWPWYNNTAFMYEMLAIWICLSAFKTESLRNRILLYTLSALFVFLTFFTKQDYGGLTFIFCFVLIAANALYEKKYVDIIIYVLCFAAVTLLFILPLPHTEFRYWFNLGQAPHESRLSIFKILDEIFFNSTWEKFYILVLILFAYFKLTTTSFKITKPETLLFLITLGVVLQALITKSTSGNATGNTTYFHGFAIGFILYIIAEKFISSHLLNVTLVLVLSFFWFSSDYWKYVNRMFPVSNTVPSQHALASDSIPAPPSANWVLSDIPVFQKVKLPEATIEGIKVSKQILDSMKISNPKVLNMTELTMLAYEWKYEPIKGLPLWYHVGVGIFQKQIDEINTKISANEYHMVMFETIPQLIQFFPEEIRSQLKLKYKFKQRYLAPRKEGDAYIEVYTRK